MFLILLWTSKRKLAGLLLKCRCLTQQLLELLLHKYNARKKKKRKKLANCVVELLNIFRINSFMKKLKNLRFCFYRFFNTTKVGVFTNEKKKILLLKYKKRKLSAVSFVKHFKFYKGERKSPSVLKWHLANVRRHKLYTLISCFFYFCVFVSYATVWRRQVVFYFNMTLCAPALWVHKNGNIKEKRFC